MTDRDVTPNLKPRGDCECGCGEYGTLNKRGHVARACRCPSCRNRNNSRRGDAKARKVKRLLGLHGPLSRHEETWQGPIRVEVKSGRKAGPVATFYRNCRDQSDAARAVGDVRPFVAVGVPDGDGVGFAVIRVDDLAVLIGAA